MKIVPYLAMTAAEFEKASVFPEQMAWMACHYSPYGTGLSNLPRQIPSGSLLILNDRTPICGHDADLVARQLGECAEKFSCAGILLDFQRPGSEDIVKAVAALPYPVASTPPYAEAVPCAVFLPPPPLTMPPEKHIAPWHGREIWLEVATEETTVRVTADGSAHIAPHALACPYTDTRLHCRYGIRKTEAFVDFYLQRGVDEWNALMREASECGISVFVGLYQQLGSLSLQADAQETARFQS